MEPLFLPSDLAPVVVLRNFPVCVTSEFLPSFGVSDPLQVQAVVTVVKASLPVFTFFGVIRGTT